MKHEANKPHHSQLEDIERGKQGLKGNFMKIYRSIRLPDGTVLNGELPSLGWVLDVDPARDLVLAAPVQPGAEEAACWDVLFYPPGPTGFACQAILPASCTIPRCSLGAKIGHHPVSVTVISAAKQAVDDTMELDGKSSLSPDIRGQLPVTPVYLDLVNDLRRDWDYLTRSAEKMSRWAMEKRIYFLKVPIHTGKIPTLGRLDLLTEKRSMAAASFQQDFDDKSLALINFADGLGTLALCYQGNQLTLELDTILDIQIKEVLLDGIREDIRGLSPVVLQPESNILPQWVCLKTNKGLWLIKLQGDWD